MLIKFFMTLKEERLPVSFTELFTLLNVLKKILFLETWMISIICHVYANKG